MEKCEFVNIDPNNILFLESFCYESNLNMQNNTCLYNVDNDILNREESNKENCRNLTCTEDIKQLQARICIERQQDKIAFFALDYNSTRVKKKQSISIFEQDEHFEVEEIALIGNNMFDMEVYLKIISIDAMYQLKFNTKDFGNRNFSLIYLGSKEEEDDWQPLYEEKNGKIVEKAECRKIIQTSTSPPIRTSLSSAPITSTSRVSTTPLPISSTSTTVIPTTSVLMTNFPTTANPFFFGDLSNGFIIALIIIGITLITLFIIIIILHCCGKYKATKSNKEPIKDEVLELMPLKNNNNASDVPEVCAMNTNTYDCTVDSQGTRSANQQRSVTCNENTNTQTCDTASRQIPDEKTRILTTFSAEYPTFNDEYLHLENKELIGEGAFGNVYKCLYMESNRYCYVAVKEPKKPSYEAFKEENIMSRISDHPNIVKLITTRIGSNMHLVMPLLKCNLSQLLYNNPTKPTIGKRIRYCHQISQGMTYLVSKQIVHCDLKASNILVVDENLVQISDFGKALGMGKRKAITGTITHTAKELLDSFATRAFSCEATDIWSFGVTIWEIFNETEQIPYKAELNNVTEIRILEYLYDGKHLKTTHWPSKDTSPPLITIESYMKRCLVHDQELRPTFVKLWEVFETMLPEGQLRKYKAESSESEN